MINEFYKNFKVNDYLENESFNNKKYIDCSLGTNPFLKNKQIEKYVRKMKCVTNEYPLAEYDLLKQELLKLYSTNLTEKNISFGSGSMGVIRNLCEFLIEENTKILGIEPQFTRFISEVNLKKGIYEYYSLDEKNNYKFNVDDFMKMITSEYSVIYINNPNNPTGQIIDLIDIKKIVQKANKFDIIVIIDEAYGDYMDFANSSINLVEEFDNLITIRSASKFYGLPNHRIGYLFANEKIIQIYNEISCPFPFSDLSANIFTDMLKDYKKLEKPKQQVEKAKKEILKNLSEENYFFTCEQTPIFTLKANCNIDLSAELLQQNIITESGRNFVNLNKSSARIRINSNYNKLLEKLKNINL